MVNRSKRVRCGVAQTGFGPALSQLIEALIFLLLLVGVQPHSRLEPVLVCRTLGDAAFWA